MAMCQGNEALTHCFEVALKPNIKKKLETSEQEKRFKHPNHPQKNHLHFSPPEITTSTHKTTASRGAFFNNVWQFVREMKH
jgi:hypothetical protein